MISHHRLDSLEGLRFVSSLAIVAGHYVPYVATVAWISKLHLAVDLFFVISGIVIAEGYAGRIDGIAAYLDFMRRRVARLYPLHLATFLFYLLIGFAVWKGALAVDDADKYNPAAILPNLLMIHAWLPSGVISFNYVSWSISAEFFAYLLFPLLAWAILRGGAGPSLLGILLLLIAFIVVSEVWLGQPLTKLSWDAGVLRAIPGFAFGIWLSRYARHGRANPAALGPAFHALMLLLVALVLVRAHEYAVLAVVWGVVALAFLCDRAGVPTLFARRWLSSRGELTYSIYMLHTVVATIFLAVIFPRLLGTAFPARLAGLVLALAILYGASRLSLRFFEDPLRRLLNDAGKAKLSGKKSARA